MMGTQSFLFHKYTRVIVVDVFIAKHVKRKSYDNFWHKDGKQSSNYI